MQNKPNNLIEQVRKIPTIFSLPIFWMFLGPPALRVASDDDRSGLSSLEGDQDIWNYVRIAWWLFWGTVAIYQVAKEKQILGSFLAKLGNLYIWVGLYLGALFLSTIFSPVPLFTLANVTMLFLLVVASLDLALKIYGGVFPITRVLQTLLWTSVFLLIVVSLIYLLYPGLITSGWYGVRLRGESFAYAPLLSLVCIMLGTHFLLAAQTRNRLLYLFPILFGFYWLFIGQTRSAYLGLAIASIVFFWSIGSFSKNLVRLAAAGIVCVVALIGVLLMYGNSQRVTWYLDQAYARFVVRDYWALQNAEIHAKSITTLNGRTEAAAVLIDGVASRPYGLGYIGGVRTYMASPAVMAKLPDEAFIGAHNGYLEVLGGGGVLAFIGYIGILMWLVWHGRRFKNPEAILILSVLTVLLVESFFESEIAYPFHQSPVLLWILAAAIMASVAYDASLRQATAPRNRRAPEIGHPLGSTLR